MKTLILTLLLFLSINLAFAGQNENGQSKIPDKVISELKKKVNELQKENITLKECVNTANKRIDDWYKNLTIWGSIFIVLLGGLLALQWSNTRGIARKYADEELKECKDDLDEINKNIDKSKTNIETLNEFIGNLKINK